MPVQVPGVDIKGLPKDQYQVMLELKQNIWDGGEIRSRKEQVKASSDVDREKLNVDMYALTERVNQVYFGILLLDEQLRQNQLFLEDLERTHKQISSYIENGIASQSDLDAVSVEQLNTRQKRIELDLLSSGLSVYACIADRRRDACRDLFAEAGAGMGYTGDSE